jgi:hypothetical protein
MSNALYYGDNLDVLRDSIADESVDLIYLDPPFNSQATYNVLFRSPAGKAADAQIKAFEDTWHWGEHAERAFSDVLASPCTQAAELLRAMRSFLGDNDVMAYLAMMAVRLTELPTRAMGERSGRRRPLRDAVREGAKIQIITLAELFQGIRPRIPRIDVGATFRTAAREAAQVQERLL